MPKIISMNYWQILLLIVVPMLILAGLIAYFFQKFLEEESLRRSYKLKKDFQKEFLPQKLHAYERVALFLERIKPSSLAQRAPLQEDLKMYEYALIKDIQTEFEHNLSQQIYVNPETWKIVYSAKNATQNFVREVASKLGPNASPEDLQKAILTESGKEQSPSSQAILYLQKDIQGNL